MADFAARCGSPSATYFSQVFRQYFGHRQRYPPRELDRLEMIWWRL